LEAIRTVRMPSGHQPGLAVLSDAINFSIETVSSE
jgi:hypothetical protein